MKLPKLEPILIPTKCVTNPLKRAWIAWTTPRRFRLLEDYYIPLHERNCNLHEVVIPAGTIIDGASIPRIFWWFVSPYGVMMLPSMVHDFAYKYDYMLVRIHGHITKDHVGASQRRWDRIFRELGVQINGVVTIDWICYIALRLFGFVAYKKARREQREWHVHAYEAVKAPKWRGYAMKKSVGGFMLMTKREQP